jgi:hypothetical protein
MKFLHRPNTTVGVVLSDLPLVAASDPVLTSSYLAPFLRTCYIPRTVDAQALCPVIVDPYRSDGPEYTEVLGLTAKQVYDPRTDVAKYSHPVAAAISYLGEGYPSPHPGDNGFLHIGSESRVRRRTPTLHNTMTGSFGDLPYSGLQSGSAFYVPFYSQIMPNGTVLAYPIHTYNVFAGGGSLPKNLRSWDQSIVERFHLPFTVGGPKVCNLQYLGGLVAAFLESISMVASGDSIRIEWVEWFVNYLQGRARRLVVSLEINLLPIKGVFDYDTYSWQGLEIYYHGHSTSQWYTVLAPGFGSEYSTLTPDVQYSSTFSHHSGVNVTKALPLNLIGGSTQVVDLSRMYSDAATALERMRVGSATSCGRIADRLRLLSADWVEFAGEFDDFMGVIDPEAYRSISGYFAEPRGHPTVSWWNLIKSEGSLSSRLSVGMSKLDVLRNAIKGISALYVAGRFSITPAVQNVSDIHALGKTLRRKLDLFKPRRIRSGPVVLSPSEQLFDGLLVRPNQVTINSACSIGDPYTGEVPSVLLSDSLGVFPKPSRWWNLAPWSWAIDMFTHFQGRIEAVETIFFLSLWRARGFTHSVKFSIEGERFNEILSAYNLEAVDSDASFECYMREISALIPFTALREEYHLADVDASPDWTILLAVLLTFVL